MANTSMLYDDLHELCRSKEKLHGWLREKGFWVTSKVCVQIVEKEGVFS